MNSHSQTTTASARGTSFPLRSNLNYPQLTGLSNKVMYLRGNGQGKEILAFGMEQEIALTGARTDFDDLQYFIDQKPDWVFGYFGYELKNSVEKLSSSHPKTIDFPPGYFFIPQNVWERNNKNEWVCLKGDAPPPNEFQAAENGPETHLEPVISKETYLDHIRSILEHIHYGDVYELNFCQEFVAKNTSIDPYYRWIKLNELTQAPFASYFQLNHLFQLGASPERFMHRQGNRVISQPIKGTIARGSTDEEDERLKAQLVNTPKERQENIMITDLVRNDLSKNAMKGSVKVDELCGLYSFKSVHQLISTVSCLVEPDLPNTDIIKGAFPMGSMTGAPKVRAMELIEKYESMSRGIYSGAIGYFSPEGDFDFNVVIRALMYDDNKKHLSAMVGGAITAESDPELEYDETLLKAEALQRCLKND
jgi:para-aminobenzoate synthetase component 1